MDVFWVDVINLHIDAFLTGVLVQIRAQPCRGIFGEKWSAFKSRPNQMNPNARIRMERHEPKWDGPATQDKPRICKPLKRFAACSAVSGTQLKLGVNETGKVKELHVWVHI